MANNMHPGARGGGYGLDAELAEKNAEKSANASDAEQQAIAWIQECTGLAHSGSFAAWLKDGTVLCSLVNAIRPGSVKKVNQSTMPFKQMENIKMFLQAARDLGVRPHDCFETVDLFEEKDLVVVIQNIHALGSAIQTSCPEFGGPKLGAKPTDAKVASATASSTAAVDTQAARSYVEQASASPSQPVPTMTTAEINARARGGGYGLDAELAEKQAEKAANASDAEQQAITWIQECTGLTCSGSFAAWLKDGTVLCNLANAIRPGSVKKVNDSTMPFKQMENIKYFLQAARELGVQPHDCFETLDLFEEKDLVVVITTIHSLGSAVQKSCPEFSGPKLSDRPAEKAGQLESATVFDGMDKLSVE